MTEEQYPDPPGEAAQRLAQAMLPAATAAEIAARLLADRQHANAERDRQRAAEQQLRLAADQARAAAAFGPALRPDWLAAASIADLGAAWQAAWRYAGTDPGAAEAVTAVEDRLREAHPPAMHRYDTLRAAGHTPHAAMADAARTMATVHPHPQGTARRAAALDPLVTDDTARAHAEASAYTPGLNPHWVRHTDIRGLAAVWSAAHQHTATDPRAVTAAHQVEQQLRRLHPPAMRRYDELRATGATPEQAMREAAVLLAFVDPTARPGTPAPQRPQLPPGSEPIATSRTTSHRASHASDSAPATDGQATDRDEPPPSVGATASANITAAPRAQMYPNTIRTDLAAAPQPAPPALTSPAPTTAHHPTAAR